MLDGHGVNPIESVLLFPRSPNVRQRLAVLLVERLKNVVLPTRLVLVYVGCCWRLEPLEMQLKMSATIIIL